MRFILVGLYDLICALRKVNINSDLREHVRMFFGLCFDDLRKNLNFTIDALIYLGNNLENDFSFDAPEKNAKDPEEYMNFFDSQTQSVSRKLAKHKQLLLERDTLIMLITDYMDLLDFYERNRYEHLTLEEKKKLYKEVVRKKRLTRSYAKHLQKKYKKNRTW